MARGTVAKRSFRDKVAKNSESERTRASNYGHLRLPRGVNVYKESADGRKNLDFLPYIVTDAHHPDRDDEDGTAVPESTWYRRPYRLHKRIGSDDLSIVCLGKRCPICEYRSRLLSEGAKYTDKIIGDLKATDRNLYYVVPKGDKNYEERPHVWDISKFLFQDKLNDELQEDPVFGDFPELDGGRTLRIRFVEKTFKTESGVVKYFETSAISFADRDYNYDEKQIQALVSLDDILDVKTYDEVERIFTDRADDDPAGNPPDDDDDGRPAPRSRRRDPDPDDDDADDAPPPRTRRRDPEPEPEKEEDQSEVDEVEDIPPPRSRRAPEPEKPKPVSRRRDPDPAPEPEKTKPPARRASESEVAEGECPHGHVFGKDNDEHSDCDECEVWQACSDARPRRTRPQAA